MATRTLLAVGACAASLLASTSFVSNSLAQGADCPPDAFCEAVDPDPTAPEPAAGPAEPDAPPAAARATPTVVEGADGTVTVVVPPSSGKPPRVVVINRGRAGAEPTEATREAPAKAAAETPCRPPAPPAGYGNPDAETAAETRHRSVGLTLRGAGVLFPGHADDAVDPRMGGFGLGLRFRPVPAFALELATDVLLGRDPNGMRRFELPFSLNAMVYLHDGVVQPYLVLGGHFSRATLWSEEDRLELGGESRDIYTYVGGQGGAGLELRVSRLVGLSVDGLAFVRRRIGDEAERYPEFYDPETGERSNMSVGGMVRGGLNFWW
jgi:hypothetical protein